MKHRWGVYIVFKRWKCRSGPPQIEYTYNKTHKVDDDGYKIYIHDKFPCFFY